jgi:hypothetical protein
MEAVQSITQNSCRIGRFTSSKIAALLSVGKDKVSFGKPALTYIEEKNFERKLGRSLSSETSAKPTSWGKLLEKRVLEELLGTEYRPCSAESIEHPELKNLWAGSPDAEKFDDGKTVVDIKCPFTLKSFCQFATCASIDEVREKHPDGEDYYQQLVSNSTLTSSKYAELIVYCPYKTELAAIRELAANFDGDQNQFYWIDRSADNELPYLIEGGQFKNLIIFRFEVPQSDKDFLTKKVIAAGNLLVSI